MCNVKTGDRDAGLDSEGGLRVYAPFQPIMGLQNGASFNHLNIKTLILPEVTTYKL